MIYERCVAVTRGAACVGSFSVACCYCHLGLHVMLIDSAKTLLGENDGQYHITVETVMDVQRSTSDNSQSFASETACMVSVIKQTSEL